MSAVPVRDTSAAVLVYIRAKLKARQAQQNLERASKEQEEAHLAMQEAWRFCRNAMPGVYSFKEMGRIAVLVQPNHDYPELTEIVP